MIPVNFTDLQRVYENTVKNTPFDDPNCLRSVIDDDIILSFGNKKNPDPHNIECVNSYNDMEILVGFHDVLSETIFDYSHRWDGPCHIVKNGAFEWWINNKLVAWVTKPSLHSKKYYIDGSLMKWAVENDVNILEPSEHDVTMIKLFWS